MYYLYLLYYLLGIVLEIQHIWDLKSATKRYVRDYNIKPKISDSVIITVDDLLKDRYIKENPNIDKYCIDNVTMFRGLFMNEYEVHSDCKE